jgi:glucokinase
VRQLGLDLGGTNVKWAILEDGVELIGSGTKQTLGERGPEEVVRRLGEIARQAIAETGPVDAVGIGVPGLYDRAGGTARFMTNLPGDWAGVPVAGPVAEELGLPVDLINDARAFALAEATLGAGRGHGTVACYTLGTGIGGGVVVGGRLHEGLDGQAGELGHQTVDPSADAPVCGCGNRGCVEAVYRAERKRPAGPDWERVAAALGIAVANTVLTLTPERVVIGGGVAGIGETLLGPLRRVVAARVRVAPVGEIVGADLGPVAGAIGAALRAC